MNICTSLRITALLFLLCCMTATGQTYRLEVDSGAYQDLSEPRELAVGELPESIILSIPFTIEAFGARYNFETDVDFASMEIHGFIFLENPEIDRVWICRAFLAAMQSRDETSSMSYKLSGDAGRRILKFQWKNMGLMESPDSNFVNAQIWLYEENNMIEVRIGPNLVTSYIAMDNQPGPAVGMLVARADFEEFYDWLTLIGNPNNPMVYAAPARLQGVPRNGTIYRFHYDRNAGVDGMHRKTEITFHPNPAAGNTRISLPENLAGEHIRLVLHDVLGREALVMDKVMDGVSIPTGSLGRGMYFPVIIAGAKRYSAGGIVVQ